MGNLRANATALAGGLALTFASVALGAAGDEAAAEVCGNRVGLHQGFFYTFWKDAGEACMTLGSAGRYRIEYDLRPGNLVAGVGWRTGSASRRVGYHAAEFDPGTNSYLALYGWSTDPLVEYYVVDNWGREFKPPGAGARALGTVESDGGTYRIYRTQRIDKPSIRGIATFYQYWSVRTSRARTGTDRVISLANHVTAWRRHGLELGTLDYQVIATEGYGSTGRADLRVWDDSASER
jgi:endo-1,4-beta-xylanase